MSRKEWIAVILVVGLGIVWQIPRHDEPTPAGVEPRAHPPAEREGEGAERVGAAALEDAGPYRTVTLEVTGMT